MQPSAALDVGEARRLGRNEPIAEAELLAERDAVRLLNQQRVGAAVDREAVDLFAEDDAAGASRALEHDERDAAALCSSYAAASPAMPPPTMTTSGIAGL